MAVNSEQYLNSEQTLVFVPVSPHWVAALTYTFHLGCVVEVKPLCLGNPMDRGSWRVTVHGVTKNWTQLHTHTGILWEAGCVLRVGVKYSMEGPA